MILWRYISREIFLLFIVSLLTLNSLLVSIRLATLVLTLSQEHLYFRDYVHLFSYLMPYFLTFTLPLAGLIAVLFTFMRLSQDQEILAFQSLGIPFRKLLPPVITLALLTFLLSFWVTLNLMPWSKRALRNFLFDLTQRKLAQGIPPKSFINWIPGFSIFVQQSWHGGKNFASVFIVDRSTPSKRGLIFASKGQMELHGKQVIFRLFNGCIHLVNHKYNETEELRFKEYVYRFDLTHLQHSRSPSRGELSLSTLRAMAKKFPPRSPKRLKYLIEYWKRLAFPGAAFFLALLGAPLGITMRASGKGLGLLLAVMLFLLYYFLFSAATNIAQRGLIPPGLSLNIPNMVMGGISLLLLWFADKGKLGFKP